MLSCSWWVHPDGNVSCYSGIAHLPFLHSGSYRNQKFFIFIILHWSQGLKRSKVTGDAMYVWTGWKEIKLAEKKCLKLFRPTVTWSSCFICGLLPTEVTALYMAQKRKGCLRWLKMCFLISFLLFWCPCDSPWILTEMEEDVANDAKGGIVMTLSEVALCQKHERCQG